MGARTWHQTGYWQNDLTLFSRTLEIDGERNAVAHRNIALWYFEFPHDLEKSIESFEKAWEIDPQGTSYTYELYIFSLCELGQYRKAYDKLAEYQRFIVEHFGIVITPDLLCDHQTETEKILAESCFIATAACWIADPKMLNQAEEALGHPASREENQLLRHYLKLRIAEEKKSAVETENELAYFREPRFGESYLQFRYLARSPAQSQP